MLVKVCKASDVRPSEITPKAVYLSRRKFLAAAAAASMLPATARGAPAPTAPATAKPWQTMAKSRFSSDEPFTALDSITRYNNFYEFGTDKEDPARNAGTLKARPWMLIIDGLVAQPLTLDVDALIRSEAMEERIYRLRCVEAWSMVIPWVGFPLANVLKRAEPLGTAKFVAFQTLHDPKQMPSQTWPILEWPYVEGLRLDEAMHPLAILAVGLYGEVLPNQNGAPIRLVVPWKYGFKSIKSVVRLTLTEAMPPTAWNRQAPQEYGFYANVNPTVDHPRWSQKRERRIGEFFRRETLMFNGYGEEVASLYAGMDLRQWY